MEVSVFLVLREYLCEVAEYVPEFGRGPAANVLLASAQTGLAASP